MCAGRQRDAEVVGRRNEAEPRPDRLLLRLSGRPHLLPRVPPPEELGCWLERRCRSRGSRTYLGRKTAEQHARHPAACTCPAAARSRDTGQAGQARHARRPSTPRPWSGRGVPRSSAGNQRCERRRVMQAWRPPSHRGARTPSSSESESLEHHPEATLRPECRALHARPRPAHEFGREVHGQRPSYTFETRSFGGGKNRTTRCTLGRCKDTARFRRHEIQDSGIGIRNPEWRMHFQSTTTSSTRAMSVHRFSACKPPNFKQEAVGGRRSARGSRRVAVGAWRSERGGQGARRWARGGRRTARAHGEGARRPEARIIRSRRGGWRGCARDVAALCRGLPLRGRIFGRPPRPSAACAAAGRVDGEPWRARGPQIRARRSGPSGGQARRRTRAGPNAIPSSTTGLPYVVTASPAPARF